MMAFKLFNICRCWVDYVAILDDVQLVHNVRLVHITFGTLGGVLSFPVICCTKWNRIPTTSGNPGGTGNLPEFRWSSCRIFA